MSSQRTSPSSYYTFFADRVSATPSCDPPSRSAATYGAGAAPPALVEPRRTESRPDSPENDYGYRWTASPAPLSAALPGPGVGAAADVAAGMGMGIGAGLGGAADANPPPLSPVFAPPPPLPPAGRSGSRGQLRPLSAVVRPLGLDLQLPFAVGVSTPNAGQARAGAFALGLGLDPDGMPLGEMEEPSSPDKETVSWPGR